MGRAYTYSIFFFCFLLFACSVHSGQEEEEKALYALCEEFGQAAVSQEFMKYQHLLNTDEENEHKVIQKIFDTIRETLSAK